MRGDGEKSGGLVTDCPASWSRSTPAPSQETNSEAGHLQANQTPGLGLQQAPALHIQTPDQGHHGQNITRANKVELILLTWSLLLQ